MTGLTIVNTDVFTTTDIYHAYLIDTGKDIPTAADVIAVYPDGDDPTKWRVMGDYRSNVYFNPIVGEQQESLNKLPWTRIGTRPGTVENQAQLRWNELTPGYGQLDWEYVVQDADREGDQGFNAIALYALNSETEPPTEILLSFGYLESKIPYSLVNSIHVRFSVQIESESRGVVIQLYLKYQEHAEDTVRTGILAMHPNLAEYNISSSLLDTQALADYQNQRANKIVELGDPDYDSTITDFQVKDDTLFSKLSDYRLLQNYFIPKFPIDYIFSELAIQLGNDFTYTYPVGEQIQSIAYTKNELIRRCTLIIDDYYGPEIILYERNFIVIVSSWTLNAIQFVFFNNLDISPSTGIRCDNLIHTYYRGILVQTNSGAVIIQPPDQWTTTEIDGDTYKVASSFVDLEYHTDKYVPVNFEFGGLVATLTNTSELYYYENLYSSKTSLDEDTTFADIIDKYYCNNEQSEAMQTAKSNYDLEVLNYLSLVNKKPVSIDIGFLCFDKDYIRVYLNNLDVTTSRYFELPYPELDGARVTTGVVFANNKEIYYQSDYDSNILGSTSTLLRWTIGSSTEWNEVEVYSTNTIFRALRGLQVEIGLSDIGVVRK